MHQPSCSVRVFLATLVALPMLAACGEKQTAPTPTPTASSVTVSCDATLLVTIGQQARCLARLILSDSSTQDQTSAAQWSSSDSAKVAVSAGGQIAAVGIGSAEITAVVSGVTGRQVVTVSAACEFSVSPQALSFAASGGPKAVTVTVELVVTLTTGAALGTPIRSATGCEVSCGPSPDAMLAANPLERLERGRAEARVRQQLY